jgi:uncharacterized membrane protein
MWKRLGAFGLSVLALGVAGVIFCGESMMGLTDGYVSDYDRAAHLPRLAIGGASALLGAWLAIVAIKPRDGSARRLVIAVGALVMIIALLSLTFEDWFKGLSGLDYGQGG